MFSLRPTTSALRLPSILSRAIATTSVLPQAAAVENSNASEAPAAKKSVMKKFSIYRWVSTTLPELDRGGTGCVRVGGEV